VPINWNLREWLAVNRKIYRATDLQALIVEKTGVYLSIPTLSALMTETPGAIRFKTMLVLCTALECKLSDFCDIEPESISSQQKKRKAVGEGPLHLYKHKPSQPATGPGGKFNFPDLRQSDQEKKDIEETDKS